MVLMSRVYKVFHMLAAAHQWICGIVSKHRALQNANSKSLRRLLATYT